jgi:hypothetical protein
LTRCRRTLDELSLKKYSALGPFWNVAQGWQLLTASCCVWTACFNAGAFERPVAGIDESVRPLHADNANNSTAVTTVPIHLVCIRILLQAKETGYRSSF